MEYRNLVTFLRVAELQNFTQAANSLGYAQSTVTFHIQSLEEELGVVLFDRIGKKVSLTMAGEYLISYANEMMHLEASIRDLNKNVDALPGTIRIGVVESFLYTYAQTVMPQFCEKFPKISVEIITDSSSALIELLKSNGVDLILVMSNRIVEANFVRDLILKEELAFVASPKNPLADSQTVDFYELVKQPLILPEKDSLYRMAAAEIAAQYDCVLTPSIQINNTSMIMELLEHGNFISFLPRYLVEKKVKEGKLVFLNMEDPLMRSFYVQILHHKNKWVTPQMKGLVELVSQTLGI